MSLSKCSACPAVMSRYHHYLESPISWRKYEFSDPYWTRYHHEFERMRMSMMQQQDLIDEMVNQVRASRAEHDSRISRCSAKCASITKSLREDRRAINTIESEIATWQSAVSDMHATMNSLRSRTKEMGATIERLRNDLNACQGSLKTDDFDIQSLMREMEEKRRRAEMECTKIYSTLNIRKPKTADSWCPICKSNNCVFSQETITRKEPQIMVCTEEPPIKLEPIEPIVLICPPVEPEIAICTITRNVCSICGSENCTYGQGSTTGTVSNLCPICGAENCTYGKDTTTTIETVDVSNACEVCGSDDCTYGLEVTTKPFEMVEEIPDIIVCERPEPRNVCSICGASDCQYGKGTRCKVCNKMNCEYKRVDDGTSKYLVLVDDDVKTTTSKVCDICGKENCTIGMGTTVTKTCDICFKENCPYFVSGSF